MHKDQRSFAPSGIPSLWGLSDFRLTVLFSIIKWFHTEQLQADLGDTAGSVSDHSNKVSQIFLFSSAYKSYVYTIL